MYRHTKVLKLALLFACCLAIAFADEDKKGKKNFESNLENLTCKQIDAKFRMLAAQYYKIITVYAYNPTRLAELQDGELEGSRRLLGTSRRVPDALRVAKINVRAISH